MAVKDDLKESVPDFVKRTPEWSVFLKWISQNNVKTEAQLKKKLKDQIKDCQALLNTRMKDSRSGTNNRIVRQCAKKLKFLKLSRDKIAKYV